MVNFLEYAPIGLPQFQIDEFGPDAPENPWDGRGRGYLDDLETAVVRPFAVMCLTLETFALVGGIPYTCDISRVDGRFMLAPNHYSPGIPTEYFSKWNPRDDISGSSWAPPEPSLIT